METFSTAAELLKVSPLMCCHWRGEKKKTTHAGIMSPHRLATTTTERIQLATAAQLDSSWVQRGISSLQDKRDETRSKHCIGILDMSILNKTTACWVLMFKVNSLQSRNNVEFWKHQVIFCSNTATTESSRKSEQSEHTDYIQIGLGLSYRQELFINFICLTLINHVDPSEIQNIFTRIINWNRGYKNETQIKHNQVKTS